ncbi:MAG: hypothetical protein OEU80_13085 [Deltaproteobacteria bacterium]|nr:hypothetical protein [Deltaproteobacteria bacterium]
MFLRQAQDRLTLRRTVQVRLGTNTAVARDGCPARGASACAARGTPIFVVSRQQLKLPAARPVDELRSSRCRESSKCKVFVPFYCSSLALPVRPWRTTGDALARAFS